ncbi:unnamed protein product [Schistosoma mattheei]|uniref:Uncharacterized protein n=1 Tax=Schistosoma mattheei TaxID=31246 RepID=A0A183PV16_9TREM|nr:unnamed protein product [Schistosoma mattheei]
MKLLMHFLKQVVILPVHFPIYRVTIHGCV